MFCFNFADGVAWQQSADLLTLSWQSSMESVYSSSYAAGVKHCDMKSIWFLLLDFSNESCFPHHKFCIFLIFEFFFLPRRRVAMYLFIHFSSCRPISF